MKLFKRKERPGVGLDFNHLSSGDFIQYKWGEIVQYLSFWSFKDEVPTKAIVKTIDGPRKYTLYIKDIEKLIKAREIIDFTCHGCIVRPVCEKFVNIFYCYIERINK